MKQLAQHVLEAVVRHDAGDDDVSHVLRPAQAAAKVVGVGENCDQLGEIDAHHEPAHRHDHHDHHLRLVGRRRNVAVAGRGHRHHHPIERDVKRRDARIGIELVLDNERKAREQKQHADNAKANHGDLLLHLVASEHKHAIAAQHTQSAHRTQSAQKRRRRTAVKTRKHRQNRKQVDQMIYICIMSEKGEMRSGTRQARSTIDAPERVARRSKIHDIVKNKCNRINNLRAMTKTQRTKNQRVVSRAPPNKTATWFARCKTRR
jgi:hypothetical protein